jgi:hypothetical protein
MALITIQQSVGNRGKNLIADVAKIGAALVEVGPDRGGIYAPPLTVEGLGQAIEMFQKVQKLPVKDGRVDPSGGTLRRINEILNPGAAPPTPVVASGALRPMSNTSGLPTSVDLNTWSPVESSLVSEFVFQWEGRSGKGRMSYFELDENVAPRWFGALVPEGLMSFDKAHIFFHPTPSQAGYLDAAYQTFGNWGGIFHYLSDPMGAQFCAAGTGRVLIMPLLPQSADQSCGVFPQRWESIIGRIFGILKSGNASAAPEPVTSVVVSSFSSGIAYSHHFRNRANLGGRLTGVIDFDGGVSTYRRYSAALTAPAGHVVRMQQIPATKDVLTSLAAQNIFPLSSVLDAVAVKTVDGCDCWITSSARRIKGFCKAIRFIE